MRKNNKGITLVSLVVTIIVLLILAMVSVNAIVGDNGIIARAMESRFLTILSDIMFNLEDNIISINIENIPNGKRLIASEMIDKLDERGVVTANESSVLHQAYHRIESKVNDRRLNGLTLAFNGDLWYENYKRGKIQLSSNTNTISSLDSRVKITVIDGTAEEKHSNFTYYLHSLKDRDDFACWVNQYGEIVSTFPNTCISFLSGEGEYEYTAIYDEELKNEIINNALVMGIDSDIIDGKWESQVTAYFYPHFYKTEEMDKPIIHNGIDVYKITIIVSDKYENLVLKEGDTYSSKFQNEENHMVELSATNPVCKAYINYDSDEILIYDVFKTYHNVDGDGKYYPLIDNEEDLVYTSAYYYEGTNDTKDIIKNYYKEKNIDVKRVYYRTAVYYYMNVMVGTDNETDIPKRRYYNQEDYYKETGIKIEPYSPEKSVGWVTYGTTIKYLDL